MPELITIGLIADTHGLLRPQALDALAGVDRIIHAGDIGPGDIVERLSEIAPTEAIKGNVDMSGVAANYPDTRILALAGKRIFVLHNLKELDFDPAERDIDIVVAGHSHKALVREEEGVLYLNPGSAGPRRFRLPVCVARLVLEEGDTRVDIVELAV